MKNFLEYNLHFIKKTFLIYLIVFLETIIQ